MLVEVEKILDWFDRRFNWNEGHVAEFLFVEEEDYVVPCVWDNIVYGRLKRKVDAYRPYRSECIYGWVIFSNRRWWGEINLTVTSAVLARLAKQDCTFSAYRIGYNRYRVDQINHPRMGYELR